MVTNDRRTKLLPKILFGQLGVAVLITFVALAIIYYAQGYRVNFQTFEVQKTGVLVLNYSPKDSVVSINSKTVKTDSNILSKNLAPGRYALRIEKEGFIPWTLSLKIEAESVNVYKEIALFRKNITVSTLTDQNKISILNTPNDVLASNASDQLYSMDHEIWAGGHLVGRFSNEITNVSWYPDYEHILFQDGKEIRVIEKDGTNDTLLVTLQKDTGVRFAVGNKGTELYFYDDGQYKMATIR